MVSLPSNARATRYRGDTGLFWQDAAQPRGMRRGAVAMQTGACGWPVRDHLQTIGNNVWK